jgi:hypothetical protein
VFLGFIAFRFRVRGLEFRYLHFKSQLLFSLLLFSLTARDRVGDERGYGYPVHRTRTSSFVTLLRGLREHRRMSVSALFLRLVPHACAALARPLNFER